MCTLRWLDAKILLEVPRISSPRLRLPVCLAGSLRLVPPLLLGSSGMFHCTSGPPAALPGTLARLPGKAPDVTTLRDPEQPPTPVSPLRALRVSYSLRPRGFQTGEK